jgi:exodeoxyribonuclease V beta subunit
VTTTLSAFDAAGPLPTGVTLLEASAGTGKTHTIASLVVRYVAEGVPLDHLLVVTFTVAATAELRERVRGRLLDAQAALAAAAAGLPTPDDEVLALLTTGTPDELAERWGLIQRGLANFDAATIATTHGFCQQVLEGLGTAGDSARDSVFTEEIGDLVGEVVDDLYLRSFHAMPATPFSRRVAGAIAYQAVQNALAPLEPRDAVPDSLPGMRVALARGVRSELERRKRRMRIVTYDDFLTLLNATLADDRHGEEVCERVRARFSVALIDEFQDTDPVQWEIVRRAFSPATLVLIGDPKQAIYSFRGADVHTYLRAAEEATSRATLSINWRSDQALIDAYNALFREARLGDAKIPYRAVRAAPAGVERRLSGAPDDAPLRVRIVRREARLIELTQHRYAKVDSTRSHVARDLAADVVGLLCSRAEIGDADHRERVRPGHLAVLVRTNHQASLVRDALAEVGVPAVINGAGSVFGTRAADEWLRLLRAIERPASPTLAASAALTGFLGWTPARLAEADDGGLEELHAQLHRLGAVLRRRGVAALLETVAAGTGLAARILAEPGGERTMTDLRHVGQLLHEAASEGQLGVSALAAWLSERIAQADADTADEDRSRRLESDAEAVQVLTIHRAKGLEFPIVYCPFLWDPSYMTKEAVAFPVFHDPDAAGERTLDVGADTDPGFAGRYALNAEEQRGEDLRLAYVALTRARHQAVVWWAGSMDSRHSALGRLLFFTDAHGNVETKGTRTPGDDEVWDAVAALDAPGCVSVAWTSEPPGTRWSPPAPEPADLAAAPFDRGIDAVWRRSSYSSVTDGAEEEPVGSEPEQVVQGDDEPPDPEAVVTAHGDPAGLRAVPLPLAGLPAGVELGSLVHSVLERADFAAPDLDDALAALVAQEAAWRGVPITDPEAAAAGLLAAIETPLDAGGSRLRDLAGPDRIREMVFELPLVGGDTPTGTLHPGDIADLLESRLVAGDTLAAYPEHLRRPGLTPALRGYLNGSIDLVARLPDGRFAVIDYKSNRLGADPPTAFDYRPAALAVAMLRAHYPLQALLYLVALHRYLRWRLRGYDPDRHLAGAGYLFLRGMIGADTPSDADGRCGVFWWRPPDGLVPALSDLLAGGAA